MRDQNGRHRGVSVSTVVVLALTAAVLLGMGVVLTRLGRNSVALDTGKVLEALNLEGIFQLTKNDIPLQNATEAPFQPTAAPEATLEAVTAAPTPAPSPTPEPYAGGTVYLTIGGSVCVEDNVRQSCYYKDSKKYDLDETLDLLKNEFWGDVTLVTLENLVYRDGKVSSLVAPQAALHMLKNAGINTVSLGFAKALDKGTDPLVQTIQGAREEGLHVIGAYAQESEAALSAQITEVNGVKLALLHYTDGLTSNAKKKLSGMEYLLPTADRAAEDIARVKQMGADVVVVSLFWGKNGATGVTKAQKTLAQQIADAGADVIVGAGSRVIQPCVWLTRADGGDTLCCYSLGCLLSDNRNDAGVAGMLLQLTVNVDAAGHVTIPGTTYTPTYIWRYKQDNGYHYRVLASDGEAPDGMDDGQKTSRERAMKNAAKYLGEESPLSVRPLVPAMRKMN